MEISNKTFGIICVGVVAVTVYVRAQALQSKTQPNTVAAPQQTVAVAPARKRHRSIPNSAMPPDPFATSAMDQPSPDDTPVTLDDAETPTPAPTTPTTTAAAPAATSTTESENGAEDDLTYLDDLGQMADAAPTNNSVQLSDRDMLRIMLTAMPEQQRDSFRMMWFTMSPDDRQDFIDQLRGDQTGG